MPNMRTRPPNAPQRNGGAVAPFISVRPGMGNNRRLVCRKTLGRWIPPLTSERSSGPRGRDPPRRHGDRPRPSEQRAGQVLPEEQAQLGEVGRQGRRRGDKPDNRREAPDGCGVGEDRSDRVAEQASERGAVAGEPTSRAPFHDEGWQAAGRWLCHRLLRSLLPTAQRRRTSTRCAMCGTPKACGTGATRRT